MPIWPSWQCDVHRSTPGCGPDGKFTLDGSLLIRSGGGTDDVGPDMVHLRAYQAGQAEPAPILSGTSLGGGAAGAGVEDREDIGLAAQAQELVEFLFGTDMDELRKRRQAGDDTAQAHASRISVEEHVD